MDNVLAVANPSKPKKWICTKCGHINPGHHADCDKCGHEPTMGSYSHSLEKRLASEFRDE